MNAPFPPRVQSRDPFRAFVCDNETEQLVRETARALGWPADHVHTGGVQRAVLALAATNSPTLLLVDLGAAPVMEDVSALADVVEPGTAVIACGGTNDVRFYRALIASGIADYLPKPFTEEQLRDAIDRAQKLNNPAHGADSTAAKAHHMVAVIGVRGGVGTSSVAVSLAWMLAEQSKPTALLDLDLHFGTAALALDLEPGRGLTEALENPGRVDGLFLERALVQASNNLGILSAETPISHPLALDTNAFHKLQEEIRGAISHAVLDLPRHMLVQHPSLLQDVDMIVLVVELTLAAARDTIRLVTWLKTNAPSARLILVANKVPAGGREELARKEFEKTVEQTIDMVLPYEAGLTIKAARTGKPLPECSAGTKFGQALNRLGALIGGDDPALTTKGKSSLLDQFGDLTASLLGRAKS
jgi:pilus assembly protein CpaE